MKENSKLRIRKITGVSDISPLDAILAGIVMLFLFLSMFYADLTVTAQYSLTFIDSLFDGEFASFYKNAMSSGIAPEGAVYDIGIYLVFAVWGLPVWILKKLLGISALATGSLLWFKLLLVLFAVGNALVTEKIAKELKIVTDGMSFFLFLSLLFNFPIFVAAQYDVIPLFFILCGILKSIRGDKKGFLIYFSFAFTMKPFAMLPFLIILLFNEKRLVPIGINGIVSMIPLGICKIAYMLNPVNVNSNNSFLADMFPKLIEVKIEAGNSSISIFTLCVLIVCVFAYCYKPQKDAAVDGRWLIWFLYLVWCGFCMFVPIYPYWIIYLSPFLVLMTLCDRTKTNLLCFFDLIANVGMLTIMIFRYSWVYGGENTFSYLLLKYLYRGENREHSVGGLLSSLHFDMFETVVFTATFVALASIAYIAYQDLKCKELNCGTIQSIHKWQWKARIGLLYGWSLLCILHILL